MFDFSVSSSCAKPRGRPSGRHAASSIVVAALGLAVRATSPRPSTRAAWRNSLRMSVELPRTCPTNSESFTTSNAGPMRP
jgi:hypothetical protein